MWKHLYLQSHDEVHVCSLHDSELSDTGLLSWHSYIIDIRIWLTVGQYIQYLYY